MNGKINGGRDAEAIIDDLGFRAAWLEKTALMNIKKLEEVAARNLATPDALRQAAKDLAEDTRKSLTELQVCAVERILVRHRAAADVLPFVAPVAKERERHSDPVSA